MRGRCSPLVLGLALCGLSACSSQSDGASPETETTGTSFAADIQPIFDAHCVQCHAREMPQAGLVLEDGESFAMLVGVQSTESALLLVKPGAPEESYLLRKLKGTHLKAGGSGLGMPLTEGSYTPLAPETIALIEGWIQTGAKAN